MEEIVTPTVTTRFVGVRYGLIQAAISIVYFLALTFAEVDMTDGIGRWSQTIFYLAIIFLAHKNFKDQGDGFMEYSQGIGISFWIGLISSLIYSAFFYVYLKFIDSSFIEAIKTKQIEKMQEKGMSDDQIDQAMGFAGMFMTPEVMVVISIIGGIVLIFITGLIVSAFTQNRNPQATV